MCIQREMQRTHLIKIASPAALPINPTAPSPTLLLYNNFFTFSKVFQIFPSRKFTAF